VTIQRVMICDDNSERIKTWEAKVRVALGSDVEIVSITQTNLALLVSALYAREQQIRGGGEPLTDIESQMLTQVDGTDVVILDSDLSPSPEDLATLDSAERQTISQVLRNGYGDAVARQIRSYTDAGLIVVVNMFWSRHSESRVFDLTMMQDVNSFGDINVSAAELGDKSLWTASERQDGSYYPWSRPSIDVALDVVRSSEKAIVNLDAAVLGSLSLTAHRLLRSQRDLFEDRNADEFTFDDLCSSRLGFRYVGNPASGLAEHSQRARIRMAASVLRRWLQRIVMPPQNVYADAPHLYLRLWTLMGPEVDDLAAWNSLSNITWSSCPDLSAAPALANELRPFLINPAFDIDLALPIARGKFTPPSSLMGSLAFAEDTRTFLAEDYVEAFSSDIPGPSGRRHVQVLEGVGYEPAPRLLL